MRTKSLIIAALAVLTLVAGCKRKGGGYLAYCVPTATITCAHIALWKAGAATAATVPGSTTQHAAHVAITAHL